MSISVISDVHIKKNGDEAHELLMSFFEHNIVKSSKEIVLLGDIFDLMVGPHQEYRKQYPRFFQKLKEIIERGQVIHYFEGNHDLHLSKLFCNFIKNEGLRADRFILHTGCFIKSYWGKKIYFSHGDDIEIGNYGYKAYKALVTSGVAKILANYVMPYKVLHELGEKASEKSRKKGSYTFDESSVREAFRIAALKIAPKGYDYIICGHSHVKDEFVYSENNISFTYLNNGFLKNSKTFIHLDREGHGFVSLEVPSL